MAKFCGLPSVTAPNIVGYDYKKKKKKKLLTVPLPGRIGVEINRGPMAVTIALGIRTY